MSLFTQIIISALLVMMATWIYGRVRFQCDVQFMLGKTISSFKIFCIRFVVPFFIALSLVSHKYRYYIFESHSFNELLVGDSPYANSKWCRGLADLDQPDSNLFTCPWLYALPIVPDERHLAPTNETMFCAARLASGERGQSSVLWGNHGHIRNACHWQWQHRLITA